MAREQVYFITHENGPIKIGKAKNVANRLSGLQVSTPIKLFVLGVMTGQVGLEKSIHARFFKYRQSGEWFERNNEILEFIDKHTTPYSADGLAAKNQEQKEEIQELKSKLNKKSDKLKEEIKAEMAAEIFPHIYSNIHSSFCDWFEAVESLFGVINDIENELAKNGRSLIYTSHTERLIRRSGDNFFDCHWRETKELLDGRHLRLKIDALAYRYCLRLFKDILPDQFEEFNSRLRESKSYKIKDIVSLINLPR